VTWTDTYEQKLLVIQRLMNKARLLILFFGKLLVLNCKQIHF